MQRRLRKVPDILASGEHARRVSLDQDVHQHGEQVISPGRVATTGILEQADQDTQALHDAMELSSRRLHEERMKERITCLSDTVLKCNIPISFKIHALNKQNSFPIHLMSSFTRRAHGRTKS